MGVPTRRLLRAFLIPLIGLSALITASCGDNAKADARSEKGRQGGQAPAVPVVVADVTQQTVPLEVRAIGNIEAISTIDVKARASGPIVRLHFAEGADVKAGQPLFTIDPREYEQAVREAEANVAAQTAALGQAEANYQRDMANAANARTQAERFASLAAKGIVSRQENETYSTQAVAAEKAALASKATIDSARAAVQGSEAKLADARLQLSYTVVRAPISGRTGSLAFRTGDLVTANADPPLVVINQVAPVQATFSIPEQTLNELRRYSRAGKLTVQAQPQGAGIEPSEGMLNFLDNQVDPATGTIILKARFANQNRAFWPGQFVNIAVRLAAPVETVVPTAAVRTAQNGKYVFLVKPDMTVEQRAVETPRSHQEMTVVASGVRPGDRVIVEGQLRVRPGGKVRIQQPASASRNGESTRSRSAAASASPNATGASATGN